MAHKSRSTWNGGGGGGGGGGGWIHLYVLLKNGFLTSCLLFRNTKNCCYNLLVMKVLLRYGNPVIRTKYFHCIETLNL